MEKEPNSKSSIPSIINYLRMNGGYKEERNIADIYEPIKGYIYCMYNEMYEYFGKNVYKIGKAIDIDNRMNGYKTSYITNPEVKIKSIEIFDYVYAEKMMFNILAKYRIKKIGNFLIVILK